MKTPRYTGIKTFMGLPHQKEVTDENFAIVGVPFDTGQSFRTGARFGPSHLRHFSGLLRKYSTHHAIDVFDYCKGFDYGDVDVIPGNITRTYDYLEDELTALLNKDVTPFIIGGDHSITLGNLRAIAKKHGPVSLILFDSHTDTSDTLYGEKYTHGTPFLRAIEEGLIDPHRSIMVGIRGSMQEANDLQTTRDLGFTVITMNEFEEMGLDAVIQKIQETVSHHPTFLTFDIDFLDPVYAPGTGTPEAGGATTREAFYILRRLTGIHFVGFDVVEVLPAFDHGEVTAVAGCNILFEMLALLAVQNRLESEEVIA